MKNRCSSKARPEHDRHTRRFLLINLVSIWEKVSSPLDNTAQKREYWKTEVGEAIDVEAEKRKAFWLRTG